MVFFAAATENYYILMHDNAVSLIPNLIQRYNMLETKKKQSPIILENKVHHRVVLIRIFIQTPSFVIK